MLFIYDFPHKKTQDFLLRLYCEGYSIKYVIAAPKRKLPYKPLIYRIEPRYSDLIHPKKLCTKLAIRYYPLDHNSKEVVHILTQNPVDLYIISGARILNKEIIETTKNSLLNIHPGLLPENRGLDTLLWSIVNNIPIGISSHFLGNRIDCGSLIYRECLQLFHDDSLIDVSQRLIEKQSNILIHTLHLLQRRKISLTNIETTNYPYYSKIPEDKQLSAFKKFPHWLKKYTKKYENRS